MKMTTRRKYETNTNRFIHSVKRIKERVYFIYGNRIKQIACDVDVVLF